jgi:hypothetical protein
MTIREKAYEERKMRKLKEKELDRIKKGKMENKFTSGPWKEYPTGEICGNDGELVAQIHYGRSVNRYVELSEKKANASLIISAPDLLAACEWALRFMREEDVDGDQIEIDLEEAIKRAKGE